MEVFANCQDIRSNDESIKLIREAITTEPRHWTKHHVEVLPKEYLLENISTFTLTQIWQNLPEKLRNDEDIKNQLPCMEHYNRDDDTIHIDGPPPPKSRCRGCIYEKRRKDRAAKERNNHKRHSGSEFQDESRSHVLTSA